MEAQAGTAEVGVGVGETWAPTYAVLCGYVHSIGPGSGNVNTRG